VLKLNKKGVSPLIATVLLLLVAMGIGALVWGFMQEFVQEQTSTAATTSTELADCSKASFKITSCTYTVGGSAILKLENTGSIDINDFWVNLQYTDNNTATQIKDTNDLLAGSFAIVGASSTSTIDTAKVQSVSCTGVKDSTTSCT